VKRTSLACALSGKYRYHAAGFVMNDTYRSLWKWKWFGNLALVALLAACGARTSMSDFGDDRAADNDAETTLPRCAWPAIFDVPEPTGGQCRAARVFLHCAGSTGGGRLCLSDDAEQCPGPNPTPGVSYSDCQNQCNTDEYALVCGSIGPGPWPQPPAMCRMTLTPPGGASFSCCPCGT
jgi:hypothetical protein